MKRLFRELFFTSYSVYVADELIIIKFFIFILSCCGFSGVVKSTAPVSLNIMGTP